MILALQADGVSTPLSETGLAATEIVEDRSAAGLQHLQRTEAIGGASPGVLEMMGELYLRLRRPADTARLFDAALALDPVLIAAHDGRAAAYLFADNPLSAGARP